MENIKINGKRLLERIEELSLIGKNMSTGGINRQLATEADRLSREWIKCCWEKELGINTYTDAIANIWGNCEGKDDLIVLGSHNDTVPDGGKLDGALGVLMATEILQTLKENNIKTKHPVGIVSFTGEEPNAFNVSTLGTKVLSKRLCKKDLYELYNHENGEKLCDAIARLGGNLEEVEKVPLIDEKISAFIECHIEQGKRLYEEADNVASVTCITGIYREIITVTGEANHAGTTRLKDRHDAINAASELCLAIEDIMKHEGMEDLACTVGQMKIEPNSSNIIAGKVVMTLDLRTADKDKREIALKLLCDAVNKIEKKRNVKIDRELNLNQSEMPMDKLIIESLNEAASKNGERVRELVSMAGHDAANMARFTKSGMLFVQSIDGYSHCPKENSSDESIIKAAQVLLDAVLLLDGKL